MNPMREFEYFLFENFDADKESNNPYNPRNFLGSGTNAILTEVASLPVDTCFYNDSCDKHGTHLVRKLIDGGVLRPSGTALAFDCPIFLREDAAVLHTEIASKASALVDLLDNSMTVIRNCCAKIVNGFPVEMNLYHILCGMIFSKNVSKCRNTYRSRCKQFHQHIRDAKNYSAIRFSFARAVELF